MASFLSLFKKSKSKPEEKREEEPEQREPDRKLKKQLSISRSGRYKQKKQRGAIAADLYRQESEASAPSVDGKSSGQSHSPNNSCRGINGRIIPGEMRRNEQMAS